MSGAATTCEREFSVPPKKGRRFLRLSESTKKKSSAYGGNWQNARGPFYRDLFHIHRNGSCIAPCMRCRDNLSLESGRLHSRARWRTARLA
jgi:hypothetical protein